MSQKENKKQQKTCSVNLPWKLKTAIETMSGFRMDNVRVHYNSDKPRTVRANAYTQGMDIYVAAGQVCHLAHEAWHVVQQMQGRVQSTISIGGKNINNNYLLEREADLMGWIAMHKPTTTLRRGVLCNKQIIGNIIQCHMFYCVDGSEAGEYDLSQNGGYAVGDLGILVRCGAPIPLMCVASQRADRWSNREKTSFRYKLYAPTRPFKPDCLCVAEEIMHRSTHALKEGDLSRFKKNSAVVGLLPGIQENSRICNEGPTAKPDIGEAYLTVSDKEIADLCCCYHAAAVVAKDGDENITLEVFGNLDKELVAGRFNLYGTGEDGRLSFHDYWQGQFPDGAIMCTCVIEKID